MDAETTGVKMPTTIKKLGECLIPSPLHQIGSVEVKFRTDNERVLYDHVLDLDAAPVDLGAQKVLSFEVAGPRENLFFEPSRVTAGIVTCGGLCPGLNDMIKGLVTQLYNRYRVTKIYGFRYGYQGLVQRYGHTPIMLKPENVSQIHLLGGSILGSSRGNQSIVCDGGYARGDGRGTCCSSSAATARSKGAQAASPTRSRGAGCARPSSASRRRLITTSGIIDKSFGFETRIRRGGEGRCALGTRGGSSALPNGVGLVKLMGRESGFIASYGGACGWQRGLRAHPRGEL